MTNNIKDLSIKKTARIAGGLYFLFLILGIFCFFYVPSQILVDGNATATASYIMANGLLFRLGIAANIISQIIFIFLVLVLYELFKNVDKKYAKLMVNLVFISIPIAFLIILIQAAPLILLSGASFLKVFSPEQLDALVMLFLNVYNYGIIGCFCFLINSFSFLLIPGYHDIISSIIALPKAIGELSIIFWLLIKGVKDQTQSNTLTK